MYKKYNKYSNHKTIMNGEIFDSRLEGRRWQVLQYLLRAGEIHDLERQKAYELQPAYTIAGRKVRPIIYVADFVYTDKNGKLHVEDVKGYRTDVYTIKKKMFEYRTGIQITEITKEDM